jgi:hypothetical protein
VKRWPEIRAATIAVAIFFGLVDGCPLPPPEYTPEWKRPIVEPIRRAQQVVLAPVAWVRPRLRITQRWALYQAPERDRYRLWIEGQDDRGRWHILFRASDAEHAEDEALLDYTRTRGAWDPTDKPPGQYPLFASWVTRYFLDKHPELVATRVRLEKVRVVDDGFEPTGQFVVPHVRDRTGP